MASNEIELVNLSLALQGEAEIVSFDEKSRAAKIAKLYYPNTRDWVLRRHPWNAALRQAELVPLLTTPTFGWDAEYLLPAEPNHCLRVLAIDEDYGTTSRSKGRNAAPFIIQGRKLFCNITTGIKLTYIKRLVDVTEMDALLVDVIASKLAVDMIYVLSGSTTNLQLARARFDEVLASARAIDSREQGKFFDDSPTVTNRLGSNPRFY